MTRVRRPARAIVSFRGFDYDMNVAVCRRALVQRQVEGEFDTMDGLAHAIGRSRSTASRFFSGRPMSLTVALVVLDKLKLRFDEVFTACDPDREAPPSFEGAE